MDYILVEADKFYKSLKCCDYLKCGSVAPTSKNICMYCKFRYITENIHNSIAIYRDSFLTDVFIVSNVNTSSGSGSFFRLDKDYGPRGYDKSNKTLPSTQTSPLYPVNNVSQNFLSNEHLTCQHCNKTYKTETRLNRHKAQCNERDKPSNNNKHNIPSTSKDNDTTASRTIGYPWSQTGNTISSNTSDIIYDKVVFWHKNLFFLPSGLRRKI